MRKILIIIVAFLFISFNRVVIAQDNNNQQANDLQNKINEYQGKLNQLRQQKNTLSSQIQYMDTQIYLTGLQIQETEQKIVTTQKEIETLGSRIEGLDTSLNYLSKLMINKIAESYKQRSISMFTVILDSMNATDLISRIKYLKTTQRNNQKVIMQVQQAKLNFEEQKQLREEKKLELDKLANILAKQKVDLNNQKADKQRLIIETQNSEKVYQDLLSKAQAEYAAIQGIVAGAGTETPIRDVRKGDVIGSVIAGSSCNSTGTHLHFIVQEGGSVQNPFNYLKNIDYVDRTGGSDSWTPSGSWDWPLSPQIEFHQGYGVTWFVRTYGWYTFHNGIDVSGSSYNIYAVADGTVYRGSYALGCTLSYVKLSHKDSNITTLYLHSYPN